MGGGDGMEINQSQWVIKINANNLDFRKIPISRPIPKSPLPPPSTIDTDSHSYFISLSCMLTVDMTSGNSPFRA